ncbi:hypothetical protein [Streptomyces sp. BE303]|uniref:hypothetical protein n=1 Tax=Streptomyces sp. BE303 TaxID=3002528 RepID=UPI002E76D0F2|nr:hypothetical protein [Streptomyces sp. BE303]MED7951749.1 hypothetical protein [Streptomyces sp. BE303]
MGTTNSTASSARSRDGRPPGGASASASLTAGRRGSPAPGGLRRWAPAVACYLFAVALLLATDTPPGDVARYTGYAAWGVLLPGTLVFRALRRRPHTLVEDLVLGAVTGLVLELGAWALLVSLGLQRFAVAWPLLVVVPFLAVPGLRRHWRPAGYRRPAERWSWATAGVVALSSAYYYEVFLARFPILPDSETSRQYGDLPYLLSLAGNAKYNVPPTLPQVSGEPLNYHWFTFVHMAMGDLVGHVDLSVVEMRLMVPALGALGILAVAVVAHRLVGRPWAGPVAALLVFAVGEFTAAYPNNVGSWTFGAPAVRLMSFASLSLTYSQPLLIALIGAAGDLLRRTREGDGGIPSFGRGAYVLAALFALASSAAKASTLPVVLGGLGFAGLMILIGTRRVPWTIVGLGAIVGAAQLFATAAVFDFQSYALEVVPFGNVRGYWADPDGSRPAAVQAGLVAAILVAFVLNHHLKAAGMLPLLWRSRLDLAPVQWFLLGGALAGPAAYLAVNGFNASYFTLAGLPFAALLSAWGYCETFERAALPRRAVLLLAAAAAVLAGALTLALYRYSDDWKAFAARPFDGPAGEPPYVKLLPALVAAAALAGLALAGGLLWRLAGRAVPALRRRGGVVLLTAVLAVGVPATALDVLQARKVHWEGSWILPETQVQAARWVREHSGPQDVLATNSHCWQFEDYADSASCDNYRSYWLSAYSERSVLIEGWAYAPRLMATAAGAVSATTGFWDEALFRRNEEAFYHPTADTLRRLRDDDPRLRYLVVHRKAGAESPRLKDLTKQVFDNGRVAVYELS